MNIQHIADLMAKVRQFLDIEKTPRLTPLSAHQDNSDSPVISLIDTLLQLAIQQNISDVHIEPLANEYRIRLRRDGLLYETLLIPNSLAMRIISRLKIMANLDISEKRLPQDGRLKLASDCVDYRINICPTFKGEKIVLRLLKKSSTAINIENLGLTETQKALLLNIIKQPSGLILVTGPTGSGKTATLYSILNWLNQKQINIATVEDPVEIELVGINQVNIHPKIGFDFAQALRALLRQDPDIIMIGEIRDLETAEIAIKAAQTGHLVLATIHTSSAVETINRLLTMGIAPYQLATTAKLIIAQRLVRKLCSFCKKANDKITTLTSHKSPVFIAQQCSECFNGYKDRIGVFELLPISETITKGILSNLNTLELNEKAKKSGMVSLMQSGNTKVIEGVTTFDELFRVIQE